MLIAITHTIPSESTVESISEHDVFSNIIKMVFTYAVTAEILRSGKLRKDLNRGHDSNKRNSIKEHQLHYTSSIFAVTSYVQKYPDFTRQFGAVEHWSGGNSCGERQSKWGFLNYYTGHHLIRGGTCKTLERGQCWFLRTQVPLKSRIGNNQCQTVVW